MAARYIDRDYLVARLGQSYVEAVEAVKGIDLLEFITDATASIQTALRNSGYESLAGEADVTAANPDTYDNAYVKLAVFGGVREAMAAIPEGAIPLPEDWANKPEKLALEAILNGDANLGTPPAQESAVGGMIFTSADPDEEDSRPPRASREQLQGY